MRDLCSQDMCLLYMTLIAAKGSSIVQLGYQKHEKVVSLPKILINILMFQGEVEGSQEKHTIDQFRIPSFC